MTFWKLGCNWGRDNPDFYDMIKEKSIVICDGKEMRIGDYVAVCKGHNVNALAKIIETPTPVTEDKTLEKIFIELKIDYKKSNKIARAVFYELPDNEKFSYTLQQGICKIAKKDIIDKITTYLNKIHSYDMKKYIELLENHKNIIFTGSPGTGKTYLAKQIAMQMITGRVVKNDLTDQERERFNNQCCFVQFHPSYDYTDFVEGLRAEDLNGQVIFNLHNGTFKEFCKKAITGNATNNFDSIYQEFINELMEDNCEFETPVHYRKFRVEVNSKKSLNAIPQTEIGTKMTITKSMLYDYVVYDKIRDWKPYVTAIGNRLKEKFDITNRKSVNIDPFVFIIDEINRGEISRIFGELFFSIDPSYRGEAGKVKTQYANIQSDDTIFDEDMGQGWFYVPKNIFIIGTMNDIDRSVDSMDFAMRRRFAWIEIEAKERVSMWENDSWKDIALTKMNAINEVISNIKGLGSSYHIGPAYFLKLNNYSADKDIWSELWEYNIEPLVKEYLRGLPDVKEDLKKIKLAYDSQ